MLDIALAGCVKLAAAQAAALAEPHPKELPSDGDSGSA
jgi:hypothetical protein